MDPISRTLLLGAAGADGDESYWWSYNANGGSYQTDYPYIANDGSIFLCEKANVGNYLRSLTIWNSDGTLQRSAVRLSGYPPLSNADYSPSYIFENPDDDAYFYTASDIVISTRDWSVAKHDRTLPANGEEEWSITLDRSGDYGYGGFYGANSKIYVAGDLGQGLVIGRLTDSASGPTSYDFLLKETISSVRNNGIVAKGSNDSMLVAIEGYSSGANNNNQGGVLLLKYNSSGQRQWVKYYGRNSTQSNPTLPLGLAVDSSDNVYVYTYDSSNYPNDPIIVKYDSSGTIQWHKQFESAHKDQGLGVDDDGNVYLLSNKLDSDPQSGHPIIWKLDSSGNLIWARRFRFQEDVVEKYSYGTGLAVKNGYLAFSSYTTSGFTRQIIKYPLDGSITGSWTTSSPKNVTLFIEEVTGQSLSTPSKYNDLTAPSEAQPTSTSPNSTSTHKWFDYYQENVSTRTTTLE